MRSLKGIGDLFGKKVLLRIDLNVPIKDGKALENFRIKKVLPTINFLKESGAKIILLSHLEDKNKNVLGLGPVYEYLRKYFPEIIFASDFSELKIAIQNAGAGDLILLENLRNWPGEKSCDENFINELASFGDIYINDAFSVSHREHASIVGLPKKLPSFTGFLFEEELKNLSKVFSPEHPFLFILGGAKTETKLPLFAKFIKTADYIFIGGVLANDFLKARGFEVGKSLVSKGIEEEIIRLSQNSKVILSQNVIVGNKDISIKKSIGNVSEEDAIKDVVVSDLEVLERVIQKSKFILWNGPMGNLEESFLEGTQKLAKLISQSPAKSIMGGGDTISALDDSVLEKFSFVSTAGGAMLDFLANETLPGIEALELGN
ncbi:MAG: phosphoglycerate kinase [Candidatus Paceibacterota bacterium]|nr:MAG: phosphoglycerate kinase [Candidatus Paceibacterota bacterium]